MHSRSPPSPFFSAARPPSITRALFQGSSPFNVRLATYFGRSFKGRDSTASSFGAPGQYAAKVS